MLYLSANDGDGYVQIATTVLSRLLEEAGYDNSTESFGDDAYGSSNEADYGYEDAYDSKKKAPVTLDYSVLSIGVLTLGLILFVEIVRHWIDHQAHGKPFFNAVLLMLYSELATLGIVEFAVFLLIKYYTNIDKAKKEVFGDVHFAFFYTAVFNACQSTLTALFTSQASHRLWVRTEQLELDHYVEIREEYERISMMIGEHSARSRVSKWLRNIILSIQRPGLRRKYNNLRVQVRFHELRLQFLETHQLPLNLKVSDYLKRSEMGVLIGLVHISGTAWLLLTGGLALLYFVLGMVGYKTADVDVLGQCMTGVFFGLLFAFIIASLALQYKMERIFQYIMKTKVDDSDKEQGLEAQKNLFWFGSPSLAVSLIQFMNFGYAIALAVVIMYWPYLTLVEPYWYLLTVFGCYFIFLYNLSVLLPQFTLCTSLGYLTNYKQLHETVAHHRLEVAQKQQRRKLIERAIEHDSVIILAAHDHSTEPISSANSSGISTQKTVASVMRSDAGGIIPIDDPKEKLLAELVKSDTLSLRNQLPEESRFSLAKRESRRITRKKSMSDGVASMRAISAAASGALRAPRPQSDSVSPTIARKQRLEPRRHNRRKSLSQPGLIKGWQDITAAGSDQNKVVRSVDDADVEHKKHKSNSESEVIKEWQDSQSCRSSGSSDRVSKLVEANGPQFVKKEEEEDTTPKWKRDRAARLAGRRRDRKKSQSASAVIQSWSDFSVTDPAPGVIARREILPDILSEGSSEKDHDLSGEDDALPVDCDQKLEEHDGETLHESDIINSKSLETSCEVIDLADAVLINDMPGLSAPPTKPSILGTQMEEEDGDDDDTVKNNTDKSIGNLSDVDIFQSTRIGPAKQLLDTIKPFQTSCFQRISYANLSRIARLYFLGNSYPTVSHVFGTLVVFFIIGHRVEAFIALSGYIIEVDSFGWATNLLHMYWSEVFFLASFIVADFLILLQFQWRKSNERREKILGVAALSDLILTSAVLILLLVAEAQRCCVEENTGRFRMLASTMGQNYEFEEECICGTWGSRTYTGLGMIEPFTSIIALRIFRFVFAAFVITPKEVVKGKGAEDASEDTDKEHGSDPTLASNQHIDHGHGGHDSHGHSGATALEVWKQAISQHPEIVEKYGQFSGELLQAMLGLHVEVHNTEEMSALSQSGSSHLELPDRKDKMEDSEKPETWQSHIKLTGAQFATLSPDAQGLIIAGRLGKPVRAMSFPMNQNLSGGLLSTVDEGAAELTQITSHGLVEFEVDKEQMISEQNNDLTFVAPFARLVRSMRRCDRQHLPLLTKWVSVDVVMTQFEIVYFEAKDETSDAEDNSRPSEAALISALQATRGGQGLRLCDVAQGRKVVGHLDLADVTEIHVEQDEDAVSDVSLLEKAAERYHNKNDLAVEFWHDTASGDVEADPKRFARAIRWTIMKEERLKLTTVSGTLVLRFYSDLECFENEKFENKTNLHSLSQDIALQWAVTVARIVGQDQLKQALPHFGENNVDELRDYLEVVHFHNKEAEKARKRADRDANDLQLLYGDNEDPSFDHETEPSSRLKKSILNRPKSFGEPEGRSQRSIKRPTPLRALRRSVSMGATRKSDNDNDSKIEAPSIV